MRAVMMLPLVIVMGACQTVTARKGDSPPSALPFYDSADFTPRWTATSDHQIADFALTTQLGRPLTRRDLLGRLHVAPFIFTTCPNLCPRLVEQLTRVADAFRADDDVRLVSYTVTPVTDTVERLATFGAERRIDPSRWFLVTGSAPQIARLARDSYFADDRRLDEIERGVLHTEKVLLVDRGGHLRGVYNGSLPYDITRLIDDLRALRMSH